MIFVIDDDAVKASAVKTDGDEFIAQVDGCFVAEVFEGEGIIVFDLAGVFGEKEFIGVVAGREELDAFQVESEAVDGFEACGGMDNGVVLVFEPEGELAVEGLKAGEIELTGKELLTEAAEETFDFALGGAVADGGMAQDDAQSRADEGDFLGGVNGTVVDVELFGDAAFIEGVLSAVMRVSVFSSVKNWPCATTREASSIKAMSLVGLGLLWSLT